MTEGDGPAGTRKAHIGAAGEAVVKAALLRRGFIVAEPEPDKAVDLVVLSDDYATVVPIQVKAASQPQMQFDRAWFSRVDVVLIYVWFLRDAPEFFVFDGLKAVEAFLAKAGTPPGWEADERWVFSRMPGNRQADLDRDHRANWSIIDRRLGLDQAAGSPQSAVPFRLTRHARERVEAGEVQQAWIAETLAAPDHLDDDPLRPDVRRAWKRIEAFGGRALRVAYRDADGTKLVITAFFDRGAPI